MTDRCRRCGGTLLVELDEDGSRVARCLSCGRPAAYEDVNPEEDAVTPTDTNWRGAARAELEALIARIVSVENDKREAERILAALAQLGVPDLPALPWTAKTRTTSRNAAPWTPQEDATLARMRAEGRPMPEIAKTLGRSTGAAYKRVQALGERQAVPA